jgi:hypothetical protein
MAALDEILRDAFEALRPPPKVPLLGRIEENIHCRSGSLQRPGR